MEYIDAHLHLQNIHPTESLPALLQQTAAHSITQLWVNATATSDWASVARLAVSEPRIVPFFGLHPWFTTNAHEQSSWPEALQQYLKTTPAGIGEAGLDRRRAGLDADAQESALRIQLQLAHGFNRPICLHCVAATDWLLHIFKECPPPEAGFLLHSFNGSKSELRQFTDLGGYFSFSPRLMSTKQERLRVLFQAIAPERLLLETDTPAPRNEGSASTQNHIEPLDIIPLYAYAANLLRQPLEEFAAQLAANALRFRSTFTRAV